MANQRDHQTGLVFLASTLGWPEVKRQNWDRNQASKQLWTDIFVIDLFKTRDSTSIWNRISMQLECPLLFPIYFQSVPNYFKQFEWVKQVTLKKPRSVAAFFRLKAFHKLSLWIQNKFSNENFIYLFSFLSDSLFGRVIQLILVTASKTILDARIIPESIHS